MSSFSPVTAGEPVSIGDRIKDARKQRALSQVDLARLVGVSKDIDELLKQVAATFYHTYQSQLDNAVIVDHLTWHYQFRLLQKIRWIYQKQSVKPGTERRMLKVIGLAKQASAFIAALRNAEPSRLDRGC